MHLSLFAFLTVFLLHCTIAVPILEPNKSGLRQRPVFTRMPTDPDKLILYRVYEFPIGGLKQVYKDDLESPKPAINSEKDLVMYIGEEKVTEMPKLMRVYLGKNEKDIMMYMVYGGNLYNPKGSWTPKEYTPLRERGMTEGPGIKKQLEVNEEKWKERGRAREN